MPPCLNGSVATLYTYTVYQKTEQNYFCQNFFKFPPTVWQMFGTKMAKRMNLCEVRCRPTHFPSHREVENE